MGEKMIGVSEVAEKLGTSKVTIYRMVKDGKIPAYQIGQSYKFKPSEVEEYINNGRVANKA